MPQIKNDKMDEKLLQTKLNAISAKLLHRKEIWNFELYNNLFIILTILVPIAFIFAQYVAKGTTWETELDVLSVILSGLLIISALVSSLILKVNDKITIHKTGLKNNLYIVNECDNVSKLNDSDRMWFYRYVTEVDTLDNDTFAKTSDKVKKETYRNALKELEPGNFLITCPLCNQSPWKYEEGDCQLCGNKTI